MLLQSAVAYLPPSQAPSKTAPKPNNNVRRMYAAKSPACPVRKRSMLSFENVENVVKPPHSPVVRKRRISGLMPVRPDTL